ncbi:MAG: hypothetical protein A2275_13895 [Bacteroidetes bacterium RIFOXYA12_FULL_35_11]|nr:MAG: hypothetical protein A2X01_13190 [Bacteroidetes bacterium GWF2_35_48]OFY80403.1 MAG: hypothetical protein A2275_13895 [Bacteroidetes bacterium RIFOXYA12_FULL_35_11]OFY96646.1 MAG: hypothetical protein A2309_05635 [Bacteroidetes bacterium RIFOXYB2_FULL_35_7]OFZ05669.1 MAG: hypothetical protein A2491_20460 [Bacteroidetes bacterium RIFOXYC12_FULL_35_7]
MNNLTVSIGITTHNHELFIAEALDSILSQNTNFSFEIVICDDASSDSTISIIEKYKAANPNKIKVYYSDKNIGPFENAKKLYGNLKGKYIAWLDGDDYWTNSEKLHKQIIFLEENPDYVGCFHDALIISNIQNDSKAGDQEKKQALHHYKFYSQFNRYSSDFYPWDLLDRNIIPTASLLFRNGDYKEYFNTYNNINISQNWLIHLYLIRNSKFYYFNEAWSVYRDHAGGISKTIAQNSFKKKNIYIYKKLLKDTYYKKHHAIKILYGIINEYRQILYNEATYQKERKMFYSSLFYYVGNMIKLFFKEGKYFTGRYLKRQ